MRNQRSFLLFVALFAALASLTLHAADGAAEPGGKKAKKKDSDGEAVNPFGKPEDFGKGKKAMVAVYFDDGAWHLRVTTKKGQKDLFTGAVKVNQGKMIGKFGPLEKNPNAALADWVFPAADGSGFEFRFTNVGLLDEVSFKASPEATTLAFDLQIDGGRYPDRVLVGKKGKHPSAVPFTLPAHPKGK